MLSFDGVARIGQREPRFQTRRDPHTAHVVERGGVGLQRQEDIRDSVGRRVGFQDAHHLVGLVFQFNRAPHQRPVTAELPAPQAICKHRHAPAARRVFPP